MTTVIEINTAANPSFVTIPEGAGLPDQSGHDGQFLKTDGSTLSWADAGVSFPLLAPDGSQLAPSYSFESSPASGIYWGRVSGDTYVSIAYDGARKIDVNDVGTLMFNDQFYIGTSDETNQIILTASDESGEIELSANEIRLYGLTIDVGQDESEEVVITAATLDGLIQMSADRVEVNAETAIELNARTRVNILAEFNPSESPAVSGSDTFALRYRNEALEYSADESAWATLMTNDGLFQWIAANEQTTVGSAGGAEALPATPSVYLKVLGSSGEDLVVPAYAADSG